MMITVVVGAVGSVDGMDDGGAPALRYGRYVVRDMLGTGGMGRVLRARDPELGREVAIKVLREPGAEATARLLREARTMAALSHPNVVPIYDVDHDGDEVFIAMELVDGPTLKRWLEGAPPWRVVLSVFVEASRGLVAAHEAGLVHRDFKPDNVMLQLAADPEGAPKRVLVMDFGLARVAAIDPSYEASDERVVSTVSGVGRASGAPTERHATVLDSVDQITRTGEVVGTPLYLAPEQEAGAPATPGSDQYSFCVSLFEALYRKRPFDATTYAGLSRQKWRGKIPPAPSGSPVPRAVHDIIARGMQVEPGRRWPSMTALVDALQSAVAPRLRPALQAALAIGGLAAVVAVGLATKEDGATCADGAAEVDRTWNEQRQGQVRGAFERSGSPLAEEAVPRVEGAFDTFAQRWRAAWTTSCQGTDAGVGPDQQRHCLRGQLRDADALAEVLLEADAGVVKRSARAAASLPDPAACSDATGVAVAPVEDEATAHARDILAAAEAHWSVGRHDEGARLLDKLEVPPDDCVLRPQAAFWRGRIEDGRGRFPAAIEAFEAAYHAAETCETAVVALDASRYLVGIHAQHTGDLDAAERWYGHARSYLPHVPDTTIEEAILYYTYIPVLERRGRMDQALENLREARRLLEPVADDHPTVWAEYLSNEAAVLMHSGQLEDALTIALEAITVNETTYGPRAPDVAMAYGNLGAIYHSLSRFDEAVEANQRAADIMPIALGAEHPYVIKVLVSLTQVQTMTGRWDAAEANIQKALELGERVLPEDSPEMNRVLRTLAQMRATRDDPESALAFQQRVIDVQERTGVRDGVYVWDLVKLGEFLVTAGRHEEARTRLDEALELQTSRDDDDDVMTGQIHATIAYLWHETGAMKEADASFQRAIALIEPVGNGELYELAEVLEAHGDFLVDAGRRREAVAAYERAGAIYAASGADPADAARITKLVVAATTRPR